MTVEKCIHGNSEPFLNENSLRTIEAQFAQKLKNNEAWPKFTGSYKKKKACMPVNVFSGIVVQAGNYSQRYHCVC